MHKATLTFDRDDRDSLPPLTPPGRPGRRRPGADRCGRSRKGGRCEKGEWRQRHERTPVCYRNRQPHPPESSDLRPRRGNSAKLLHHTHGIHLAPMFHDLSTGNSDDVDHSKGYALARWRNAHELAFMGAAPGATDCHLVTFGDRVVNCDFEVREGAAKQGAVLFDGLPPRRYSGWEFLVLNESGSQQIVDQNYFSLIEDFLDYAT